MGELDMAQQRREWEVDLAGARSGNPYATLCSGCMSRHSPPRNDHCPDVAKKDRP